MADKKEPSETKKKNRLEIYREFISLYVVPLLAIILFFGIILFLIIPKVKSVISEIDNISSINADIDNKNKDLSQLKTLNDNVGTLQTDLSVINSIAPAGETEVVKFRDKISEIARLQGLTLQNQTIGETPVNQTANNSQQILVLREIPVIFELTGSFQSMKGFLTKLDTLDDFIVFKEFKLFKQLANSNNDLWTIDLTIVKYQFGKNTIDEELNARYLQIPLSAKISEIINSYITGKLQ